MIRKLLIVFIGGAIISVIAFALLDQLGGFEWHSPKHKAPLGPQATRDLPWTGTETLHLDNSAAIITYIQGPTPKFTVTGPANRINTLAIDGDTVTGTDIRWGFDHTGQIHMTVTSPNTHAFFLGGAEELTIQNYDQESLDLHLSGAGTVKAQGKAKRTTVDMSGAGHLDMREFPVDDATVDISGAGSATIDPHETANVNISGAGHVKLLTRPPVLKCNISGIGSITSPRGTTATIGSQHCDEPKDAKSKDKNDNEAD